MTKSNESLALNEGPEPPQGITTSYDTFAMYLKNKSGPLFRARALNNLGRYYMSRKNVGDLAEILKMLAGLAGRHEEDENDLSLVGTLDYESKCRLEEARNKLRLWERKSERRMRQLELQLLQLRAEFEEEFMEPYEVAKDEYTAVWDSIKLSLGIAPDTSCTYDSNTNEVFQKVPKYDGDGVRH